VLREYCPVIGASHAEGEASSSIAPWRLSVQHRLIALSPLLLHLTTLPHTPEQPQPISFPFSHSLTLFIYPSYISYFFDFLPLCEEHPSPASLLHLFVFPPSSLPTPVNFLSPSCHAPTLMWELRYYACGVVALAWGSVLRPRGVLLLFPLPPN